uniref:Uncharacterized protein n=1 Tax=Rhizophora mucronata TaxID=61149 RepID=A0A2P2P0U7_RHIMU
MILAFLGLQNYNDSFLVQEFLYAICFVELKGQTSEPLTKDPLPLDIYLIHDMYILLLILVIHGCPYCHVKSLMH